MVTTTLSRAVSANTNTWPLASLTGVTVGMFAAVDEEMGQVYGLTANGVLVQRGANGTAASAHAASSTVSVGAPSEFAQPVAAPAVFAPADTVLTGQGPTTPPVFAAGAGGSILHQTTVTLTDDEIKALHTTSITVIAAPGATVAIVPMSVTLVGHFTAGDYTNISAAAYLSLLYDDFASTEASGYLVNDEGESLDDVETFFAPGGADTMATLTPVWWRDGGSWGPSGNTFVVADIVDKSIVVAMDNESDLTGGNAANTLVVSVAYLLLDTTTGAFV